MQEILNAHQKIALQLSGGRDSIACLYLMRPHLDRITVYWLNTGDAFPETLDVMDQLRELCPHFVEIDSDSRAVQQAFGIPSDIVPVSHTPMGLIATDKPGFLIQDRYSCCFRSVMQPMHERMIEDGITLIIRGQRNSDYVKSPVKSGVTDMGIQYLFPIEDWSDEQVMDYLEEQGAPIGRFYSELTTTPDCMSCTAWWEEGRAAYLAKYHPEASEQYQARLDLIREAMAQHIENFNREVGL